MNTITIYVTERKDPIIQIQIECEYYTNHAKSLQSLNDRYLSIAHV